ncbi:alpha/beta hydrolase [Pelagibacterium halotolerans]|uniref:alpha/beta hydrolase n=1 Tax=Pelagibacterium halotolerans TaxID=531813 RepID=UPI00384F3455
MISKLSGPMLQPVSGDAKQLVVLLHGYGSDGQDLIALGQYWRDTAPDALFVAPNAHEPAGFIPGGYQWFPVEADSNGAVVDPGGTGAARPVIMQFLEDLWEQTGLGPEDTVLVGFSQGAMMALDVGLRLKRPLRGIIAFSGMVIAPEKLADEKGSTPPVLLIHGDNDEIVPVAGSRDAHALLDGLSVPVRLHIEPGVGHMITQQGLDIATAFLKDASREAGSRPLERNRTEL